MITNPRNPLKKETSSSASIPVRVIVDWYGSVDDIPSGWALCDGTNGTPDLRGYFVLGASDDHPVGETGGSEEVTLTVEQMPSHSHTLVNRATQQTNSSGSYMILGTNGSGGSALNTYGNGSGEPHPNMPPYYALAKIMKVEEVNK